MRNCKKTKKKNAATGARRERGFSLVEALVAMAITLVILSAGLMVMKSMMDSKVSATSVSEVNSDNQAALNIIRRDLQKVDKFFGILPSTGVPLPNIDWGNNRCFTAAGAKRDNCSSPDDNEMLLLGGTRTNNRGITGLVSNFVFDIVTPGIVNGHDAVSLLYVDDSARNISASLFTGSSGGSLTYTGPATSSDFKAVRAGDFVYLGTNNILQYVVSASANTITISDGPGETGSSTYSATETVHLLRRVTYFMESSPSDANPAWLMRQVNLRENPARVVPGITSFKLTYDILDKSTGIPGVMEVDISDSSGVWITGDSYSASKLDDIKDADFFIDNPFRVLNIVRVNVNVLSESDQAVQGNKRVKIDQTARIAVRGFPIPGGSTPTCADDPTLPGCTLTCEDDPTLPGCTPTCDDDPTLPGCEAFVNAGCTVNNSEKGVLCNTPCQVHASVGKPGDSCRVYYYEAPDDDFNCKASVNEITWSAVTQSGDPHAQNNSEKGYDNGVATEIKNFPKTPAYYCIRIEDFVQKPNLSYISEEPFYIAK